MIPPCQTFDVTLATQGLKAYLLDFCLVQQFYDLTIDWLSGKICTFTHATRVFLYIQSSKKGWRPPRGLQPNFISEEKCLPDSNNLDAYEVKPQFFVINFDDPRKSHRCNPINPSFMTDISDAYERAYTIMLNLNRSWIQKQGDFFVESPIILLAAIIWFLKIYENGKYCTFPHAIEFLNRPYAQIFPILTAYDELATRKVRLSKTPWETSFQVKS